MILHWQIIQTFSLWTFQQMLGTFNASLALQTAEFDSDIIFWFSDNNVVGVSLSSLPHTCISASEPFYFYCVCSTVVGYQKDKAHTHYLPLCYIMIETPHPPDNHSRSTSLIYVVEHLLLRLGFKDTTPIWYLPSGCRDSSWWFGQFLICIML